MISLNLSAYPAHTLCDLIDVRYANKREYYHESVHGHDLSMILFNKGY